MSTLSEKMKQLTWRINLRKTFKKASITELYIVREVLDAEIQKRRLKGDNQK